MRNILLLLLVMVLVSACNPGRVTKKEMPKNAPPDYQKGWQDGCESGLGTAYSNSWYKTFHAYRKDVRMLTNPMYVVGWDDGNRYCRHYAGQWVNWGYFDTADGSLRDKNVPEQYNFSVPGWNGVKWDGSTNGLFGPEKETVFGSQSGAELDRVMGWNANAGTMATGGSGGFFSFLGVGAGGE